MSKLRSLARERDVIDLSVAREAKAEAQAEQELQDNLAAHAEGSVFMLARWEWQPESVGVVGSDEVAIVFDKANNSGLVMSRRDARRLANALIEAALLPAPADDGA